MIAKDVRKSLINNTSFSESKLVKSSTNLRVSFYDKMSNQDTHGIAKQSMGMYNTRIVGNLLLLESTDKSCVIRVGKLIKCTV